MWKFRGRMKRNHVYCTCCVYGKYLFGINKNIISKKCISCYPYDPEDSRGINLRVNYKESLSGWLWLIKLDIKDFFSSYCKGKIK